MVLAPLFGSIIAGLFGRQVKRFGAQTITILGVAVACGLSMYTLYQLLWGGAQPFNQNIYTFFEVGQYSAHVGFMVDKLTGVYLSKTMHREDQPAHLIIHDHDLCANQCHETYGNPCTRFCPGNVYEAVPDEQNPGRIRIKLNPSNCFHCKTCDIKDPTQNINWTVPEGGGGPNYPNM